MIKKVFLFILLLVISFHLNSYSFHFPTTIHIIEKEMTIENIYEKLLECEILFPDIVIKQVKLETGYLKYVKENNLFGFQTKNGYMKFETWEEAIFYKKRWQERKYKGGDYYLFLKNLPYAQDSLYIQKIKRIK